jgi:hypothetical protein
MEVMMHQLMSLAFAVLGGSTLLLAQGRAADLEAPVRVVAGGAPIDVTVGHAAPCLFDVDGDGLVDLVVGEYGDQPFAKERLPGDTKLSGFDTSRLRVYRNAGTKQAPRFGGYEYLKAGAEDASIPST